MLWKVTFVDGKVILKVSVVPLAVFVNHNMPTLQTQKQKTQV